MTQDPRTNEPTSTPPMEQVPAPGVPAPSAAPYAPQAPHGPTTQNPQASHAPSAAQSQGGQMQTAAPASAAPVGAAPMAPEAQQPPAARPTVAEIRASRVDESRAFGAHLRMRWWRALIIVPLIPVALLLYSLIATAIAVVAEVLITGEQPDLTQLAFSPILLLANNLSLGALIPTAILLMWLVGGVPLRSIWRKQNRPAGPRASVYFGVFTLGVVIAVLVSSLFLPDDGSTIIWNGTTIAFLVIALLTTPLQAAGEEFAFRGAMMPAIASWIRPQVIALIVSVVISSLIFCALHGAGDPWLWLYYVSFGAIMAGMALISRGLEAPIAFHVANNLVLMIVSGLYSEGEPIVIDRSAGMGGPEMLIVIALDLLALGLVWLWERHLSARAAAKAAAVPPMQQPVSTNVSGTAG